MSLPPARAETWAELGPAMKALPNDQWRDFVYHFVNLTGQRGAQVAAARAAGFSKDSNPSNAAKRAYFLAHDQRMIAAIAEESKKILRVAYPEGAAALINLIRNPEHRDHGRAIAMLLDRVFPAETKHNVEVVHKTIDPDQEALEELRALRHIGASREKLIELFGGNGLSRLEKLEAAELERRAMSAKVIDGEAVEIVQEDEAP